MTTWAEFILSVYGLITIGAIAFMLGVMVGLNLPMKGGKDGRNS